MGCGDNGGMNHDHAVNTASPSTAFPEDEVDVLDELASQLELAESADPADSVEMLAEITSKLNAELEADQGES